MRLYLATSNLHKIEELAAMLAATGLDVEVRTAQAVGGMPEVVEDQDTFSGNALKKARALAALLPEDGLALADDSGICIEAFDGAPGVYSARYAGEDATDEENLDKLIREMELLPDDQRGGSFECHLAVVAPHGDERIFVGEILGTILRERRGEAGFGYDPVFLPVGEDRTTAEMSSEEKAAISHRGNAMRQFLGWLPSILRNSDT
ncbi:MAG: RdgB/HAM1 family non-canonical purine NTP pyrophosphatase [Opitutales bacterium]